MSGTSSYFDKVYADDDPFGYRDSWYEERKRQLLLACLPNAHFTSGWEIGCSNGELTVCLATRCESLLATDMSARAVALARHRTSPYAHVRIEQARHPQHWPAGHFDLIVFSEIGYYVDPPDLASCTARMRASLRADGTLIACHWRRPFKEALQRGDAVHAALHQGLKLYRIFDYKDDDFTLQGWAADGRSVAHHEGLT